MDEEKSKQKWYFRLSRIHSHVNERSVADEHNVLQPVYIVRIKSIILIHDFLTETHARDESEVYVQRTTLQSSLVRRVCRLSSGLPSMYIHK